MTSAPIQPDASDPPKRSLPRALVKLARPHQWAKSVFVLLGPVYGLRDYGGAWQDVIVPALIAAGAFALASSACYVVNDLLDAVADRNHPRKRLRPIARGEVSTGRALTFAGLLGVGAGGILWYLGSGVLAGLLGLYIANVFAYSVRLKHVVVADVISLSLGFVIRVLAGCAAAGVSPSTWLLNVTLFLAMFLAFGKRLGERRTLGDGAGAARGVQKAYTDELLRMFVGVTGVATLVTYSSYLVATQKVHARADLLWTGGAFSPLWLTLLPATYGLLRAIVLLERGTYDDPTELAAKDPPMQIAAAAFGGVTLWSAWLERLALG